MPHYAIIDIIFIDIAIDYIDIDIIFAIIDITPLLMIFH
jgi:hypothetical protein